MNIKTIPGKLKITEEIWEKCREYNINFKLKYMSDIPELSGFRWPCFYGAKKLQSEIVYEYYLWIDYLIKNGIPYFNPAKRHDEAIKNRLMTGWNIGEHKDYLAKTDPYLVDFECLPQWLIEMCLERDKIMIKTLKGYY